MSHNQSATTMASVALQALAATTSTNNPWANGSEAPITTTPSVPLLPTLTATASTTPAASAESDDLINNEFVQIFFCILYTTVFVLGVFGNVLVCYVVLRNRAMQTVTNIFITNLALSDILLCVLAVPFTPLYTFMGRWAFGRTLCHLVSFAQGCSIYISTLTLTSIAVDRYFVIIYPFHHRMKLSTCIAIIVSIWVVALLATLPYGMYMKVNGGAPGTHTDMEANYAPMTTANQTGDLTTISSTAEAYRQVMVSSVAPSGGDALTASQAAASQTAYCEENWPSEQYRKVFGSVTTILQFVLPFIIISICYTWVSVKLNARARSKPGTKSSRKEEADRDRKKRTNRMLISMVAVFGLSWLPINVVNIFDDFYEKSNEWRFYTLFFFVAHSIAMSSTCYNPFLYAWLNENFRKEFKHVLPCFNPSNNNIINITRGYNRSDRNTCGPRLHHRNGGGSGGAGGASGQDGGLTIDIEDHDDDNGITQDTSLPTGSHHHHPQQHQQKEKETMPIIPREATYGGNNTTTGTPSTAGSFAVPSQEQQLHEHHNNHHQPNHQHQQQRQHNGNDDDDGDDDDDDVMCGSNGALVHQPHVDIVLNENSSSSGCGGGGGGGSRRGGGRRGGRGHAASRNRRHEDYDESGDEQTIELRFSETPFVSADNATAISMLEGCSSSQESVPALGGMRRPN